MSLGNLGPSSSWRSKRGRILNAAQLFRAGASFNEARGPIHGLLVNRGYR